MTARHGLMRKGPPPFAWQPDSIYGMGYIVRQPITLAIIGVLAKVFLAWIFRAGPGAGYPFL